MQNVMVLSALLLVMQSAPAAADDVLPPHLAGSWGTSPSLYDGTESQGHMHLAPDGFGVMIGSTAALRRADGIDDGKPGPRALIGFGLRAAVEGDALIARPVVPAGSKYKPPAGLVLTCHHEETETALNCSGPDGKTIRMKRLDEPMNEEIARTIDLHRRGP